MVKQIASLALAGVLVMSSPAFAEITGNEVMVILAPTSYSSVVKNIAKIAEVENDYIVCEINGMPKVQLNISADTVIVDSETALPLNAKELKVGDDVYVEYSSIMTRSIPGQSSAYLIATNIEKGGSVNLITVDKVRKDDKGNVIVTDNDSNIILTISKDATVKPFMTKDIKTLGDIKAGTKILAWYDVVAMSLPAQASTNKVVIVSDIQDASTLKFVVAGKELDLKDCAPYYEENTLMVPLAKISEALGYTVKWNDATREATVEDAYTQKATFALDTNKVAIEGKLQVVDLTRDVENAQKTVIHNERTFIPVEFFEEFMNEISIEGNTITIAPSTAEIQQ